MIVGARLGPFRTPRGTWTPEGPILDVRRTNPVKRWPRTFAGRLFIGFNVDRVPTWTIDHLSAFVEREWAGGASIIAQQGLWRDADAPAAEPREDSGQVVILVEQGKPFATVEDFAQAVITLGEKAVTRFRQKSILFQIQDRGQEFDAGEIIP